MSSSIKDDLGLVPQDRSPLYIPRLFPRFDRMPVFYLCCITWLSIVHWSPLVSRMQIDYMKVLYVSVPITDTRDSIIQEQESQELTRIKLG